jgi:hypothetical protein
MQNALKFDHRDGGVCVVELNCNFFREVLPVLVGPAKAANDILE